MQSADKKSEINYRKLFETMWEGVALHEVVFDDTGQPVDFRYLEVNRAFEQLVGLKSNELLGKSIRELLPGFEETRIEELCRVAISGEPNESERFLPELGRYYRTRSYSTEYATFVTVFEDITTPKLALQQLAESEQRYRSMIENIQDAFYRTDGEGRLTMVSPSGVRLLGYASEAEMLGRMVRDDFYMDAAERDAFLHNLRLKGQLAGYEVTLKRRDGTPLPVSTSTHFIYGPNGEFAGVEGVFRDISAQRAAENALRSSEEKFAKAFSQAPIFMTICDIDSGRYLDVNDRFCEISGFSRQELIGRTSVDVGWISSREREKLLCAMEAGGGMFQDLELRHMTRNGREVVILHSGATINYDGRDRILSIGLDITDRLELQQEREKRQRLESLGVLAGGIAHDFNNILTGILGNISLARMMVDNGHRAAARLEECEKAAKRAGQLTQQLLTFARGGEPVRRVVDTSRMVNEAVSFGLRGSNIKAQLEMEPGLWNLYADEGQVSQVLNNLLINAKQAMPEGGIITVRAENMVSEDDATERMRYVRISIRDNGVGIPPEILPKVFDPYFTTKADGSGLGLASVYSIIKRHGGRVNIASEVGVGTELEICLPAADEPGVGSTDAAGPAVARSAGRVLIMDDEQMVLSVATLMLTEIGCSVDSCSSGREAVQMYRAALAEGRRYDAVILDLTVPGGMGGLETARLILGLDPEALLIVSSGYSQDAVMADYREHGFCGAVMKPYTITALSSELARVKQISRKSV